jgi:hypothetical protein
MNAGVSVDAARRGIFFGLGLMGIGGGTKGKPETTSRFTAKEVGIEEGFRAMIDHLARGGTDFVSFPFFINKKY